MACVPLIARIVCARGLRTPGCTARKIEKVLLRPWLELLFFSNFLAILAKLKGKYHDFLILFKSSETSATTEKDGISVMKPPLNDYKSGSGHDSNCYIYYVFMHKDLQEFWSKKTKLVGRKRFRLLKTLENKY